MKKNVNSRPVSQLSDLLTLAITEAEEKTIVDTIKKTMKKDPNSADPIIYGPAVGCKDVPIEFRELVDRVYRELCVYQNDTLPSIFCVRPTVVKRDIDENGEELYIQWCASVLSIDNHGGQHVLLFKNYKNPCVTYCHANGSGAPGVGPTYTIPEETITWASNRLNGEYPLRITEAFFDDATGLLDWFNVEVVGKKIGWTITLYYEYNFHQVSVKYIKGVVDHME